jgi:hypothetical protein
MGNNSSSNNGPLNYAGINYNIPYFIVPPKGNSKGLIISRHSMPGTIWHKYGKPTGNIVEWVRSQKANNSKKNRVFIVDPYYARNSNTLKPNTIYWTVQNVKIVNK